ncbi:AAT22 [Candida margitis]|uniref:AAT22 n=1 Tax=Candida margitis TaxID=1775924 RepID=UPI0022271E89|nr:AAT22 [Candida margitis]KAI5957423.1 AAT22 [Candida margitis]
MTVQTVFSNLVREDPDPIIKTMQQFQKDTNPQKIDVSIGVYKDESGACYEFPSITKAKQILHDNDPGHNYTNMAGIPDFVIGAQRLVFGDEIAAQGKLASIQAISGTGSLHMAMLLYRESGYTNYYIGTPTWQNYQPMIEHIGGKVTTYRHYNEATKSIDFDAVLNALNSAPTKTIFLFQTCCHNPTGADFSHEQWQQIGAILQKRQLLPLLDTAYQGFSSGSPDQDAWPVRYLYNLNLEFIVCQSFSKNLGLYSERCGAVHVVVQDKEYVPNVQSNLVALFRHECSFAPAFGARLASIIFHNDKLRNQWLQELNSSTMRLKHLRQRVLDILTQLQTPGDWQNVVEQNGLFWYSGLTKQQNDQLIAKHNVYSTSMGRVNVAGLNDGNIDHFCAAIDKVVRDT